MKTDHNNAVAAVITAKSMAQMALIIMCLRQYRQNVNELTHEQIKEAAKLLIDESNADLTMFHASAMLLAYRMGLNDGKEGTPLDTSYIDGMVKVEQKKQGPWGPDINLGKGRN